MDKRAFYLDLLERCVRTFLQGFAASWVASAYAPGMPDLTFANMLLIAALAGVTSVMMSIVAGQFGNGSASSLPQSLEPKPPQFGARR